MWIHFQEISHDFPIYFIALHSHMNSWLWIHIWFHYHVFASMNSKMNPYIWILTYDFTIHSYYVFIWDFIIMNSYATFHDMNSYMNSCILEFMYTKLLLRISWNHTWNHVYQGSRWHFAIKLTWVYSGSGLPRNEGLPSNLLQLLLEDLGSVLSHYC